MNVKPHALTIRAISSQYVLSIIRPIMLIILGVLAALLAIIIGLAVAFSNWWLLFLIPVGLVTVVIVVVLMVALFIIRAIAPVMTNEQKIAVTEFVGKMNEVSEGWQTPQFMIAFKILLDLFKRRWVGGFIYLTISNSVRLRGDFEKLVLLFDNE